MTISLMSVAPYQAYPGMAVVSVQGDPNETFRVRRTDSTGHTHWVRGTHRTNATGLARFVDPEATIGQVNTWHVYGTSPLVSDIAHIPAIPLSYKGGLGVGGPWFPGLTGARGGVGILSDVLRPDWNMPVVIISEPQRKWESRIGISKPIGTRVPVVAADIQMLSDFTLEFLAPSIEYERLLRDLLDQPERALYLRTPCSSIIEDRFWFPVTVDSRLALKNARALVVTGQEVFWENDAVWVPQVPAAWVYSDLQTQTTAPTYDDLANEPTVDSYFDLSYSVLS